ncbi:MAG: hypothetical protein AB1488_03515 [Nitrospirota bacterium]
MPSPDVDVWGLLATGRFIVENGTVPFNDPFSFTETKVTWVYHEWLSGVVFYLLYKNLTPVSIYILKVALGISISLIIIKRAVVLSLPNTLFLGLAIAEIGMGFGPRPQIFSYFFFTLTIMVLENARVNRNNLWLYLLIPLMPLWANLHGGFIAGIGVILLYSTEREMRIHCFVVAALSFMATLINPYGIIYWKYLWYAITLPRPHITEWQSLIDDPTSFLRFEFFLLISLIWVLFNRKSFKLPELLCLLVTAYLSIRHVRHTPFFAITAAMFIPKVKWDIFKKIEFRPHINRIISIILLILAVRSLSFTYLNHVDTDRFALRWMHELNEADFPVMAVNFIKQNSLKGNLAVTFEWGEYCIWKLYPDMKVSFDGRYETAYSERTIKEHWDFYFGKNNWTYHLSLADYVLTERNLPPYELLKKETEGWEVVYEDNISAVFKNRSDIMPRLFSE